MNMLEEQFENLDSIDIEGLNWEGFYQETPLQDLIDYARVIHKEEENYNPIHLRSLVSDLKRKIDDYHSRTQQTHKVLTQKQLLQRDLCYASVVGHRIGVLHRDPGNKRNEILLKHALGHLKTQFTLYEEMLNE